MMKVEIYDPEGNLKASFDDVGEYTVDQSLGLPLVCKITEDGLSYCRYEAKESQQEASYDEMIKDFEVIFKPRDKNEKMCWVYNSHLECWIKIPARALKPFSVRGRKIEHRDKISN